MDKESFFALDWCVQLNSRFRTLLPTAYFLPRLLSIQPRAIIS